MSTPSWKPAVQLFSEISTWVVAPIIVALIGGKWLDAHYGTAPRIFLVCAALGFLITIFGIVKVVRGYMRDIQDIEQQNNGK